MINDKVYFLYKCMASIVLCCFPCDPAELEEAIHLESLYTTPLPLHPHEPSLSLYFGKGNFVQRATRDIC